MDSELIAVDTSAIQRGSTWSAAHRRIAGLTVLVGLVGAVLFYTGDASTKPTIWMTSTGVMLVLMYVGILAFRRANLRPWLIVAAGLTSAYLAMFLMNYGSWFGLSFGAPSLLDGLMLANYPLALIGGILMLSRHHLRTGMHALLETITLTVAGALLIFVFVGVGAAEAAPTTAGKVVAALYPLGNVMLLAVLVAVIVRLRERNGGMILITLGFGGNLAADLISSWQKVDGSYQPGGWVDFGWLLCFIGLSAAPSWPDSQAGGLTDVLDRDEGQVTTGRMAILLFALLSAPVVLIGQQLRGADTSETIAIVGTVVVLALALARIALYNQDLRRSESALRSAHDALQVSERDKQSLLWRMNRAVEEERSRIAAEIHDRPVQQLAAVGYKVETMAIALMSGDSDRAADLVEEVADELSGQLGALRNLMVEVRPPVLDERGFFGAIEDAGRQFMTQHEDVHVSIDGADLRLDPETETVLYRVTQEALQNIGKHASASTVTITVQSTDSSLELAVRDDGRGFDVSARPTFVRDGHYGLAGMSERVAMTGGELLVDSMPGEGTTITVQVPIDRAIPTPAADEQRSTTNALVATGAN